jgi:hypothetical protein
MTDMQFRNGGTIIFGQYSSLQSFVSKFGVKGPAPDGNVSSISAAIRFPALSDEIMEKARRIQRGKASRSLWGAMGYI